jgi:Family of unknown function (DUF6481)
MTARFSPDFSERRESAEKARAALLEKFKARPTLSDPQVQEREEQRKATWEAKQRKLAERKAAKEAEAKRKAAEEATRKAAAAEEQKRRLRAERLARLAARQGKK